MSNIEILLRKAQESNDKEAYLELADTYAFGRGVAKDFGQAAVYYQKAADLGSVDGQTRIGYMYYKGIGVSENYKMAKKYLKAAADQGSVRALVELGWMCYNGHYGLLASKGKAFEFWMKASKKGDAEAQIYVGTSYLGDSWGEEKSYRKAAFWFMCAYQNRKATDNQIKEAKTKLSKLSGEINLDSVKAEVIRKHPEYLNL